MTAAKVLAALGPNARDAKEAWERLDRLLAVGPKEEVSKLAEALTTQAEPAWLVRSTSKRLMTHLALSAGHFDLLLELIAANRTPWTPLYELADCVAQRVDTAAFVKALPQRERSVAFFASLLHNLICHGADFEGSPEVQVFRDELHEQEHPFAVLPLGTDVAASATVGVWLEQRGLRVSPLHSGSGDGSADRANRPGAGTPA